MFGRFNCQIIEKDLQQQQHVQNRKKEQGSQKNGNAIKKQ